MLEQEQDGAPDVAARQEAATRLWEADELCLLVRGYEYVLVASPNDVDALYQLAAAHTQLGNLSAARDHLARWIDASGLSPMAVADQLDKDGRFALLQFYEVQREDEAK